MAYSKLIPSVTLLSLPCVISICCARSSSGEIKKSSFCLNLSCETKRWNVDLTAASQWPPVSQCDVNEAAGLGISLQKLAVETVHPRIVAQSVHAGGDVGRWVDVGVAFSEGRIHQEITAAQAKQRGGVREQHKIDEELCVCSLQEESVRKTILTGVFSVYFDGSLLTGQWRWCSWSFCLWCRCSERGS